MHGRPIVPVGLIGAGKTAVGRRLVTTLRMRFIDSDREIQVVSGMSIEDLFDRYGETPGQVARSVGVTHGFRWRPSGDGRPRACQAHMGLQKCEC